MSLQIALFASGRGSNAKAIIQAIEMGKLDAEVQCLICNIENAQVLTIAEEAGIPAHLVPHKGLTRETHEAKLLEVLSQYTIDYIVLAGYMRLMTPAFLQAYKAESHYRVVNIHPSLLPAFPGTHGYEDAFAYGVKVSGATVHFLDEAMDNGPILLQEVFYREDNDTLETFRQQGLSLEHQMYPKALQLLAENRVGFRYNSVSKRTYVEVKTHVPC